MARAHAGPEGAARRAGGTPGGAAAPPRTHRAGLFPHLEGPLAGRRWRRFAKRWAPVCTAA